MDQHGRTAAAGAGVGAVFCLRVLCQGVLLAVVVRAFVSALRFALRVRRMHKMTANIPGPTREMIARLWHCRRSLSAASDFFFDVLSECKPVFKFWTGPAFFVVITEADDFEFVMTSKTLMNKAPVYKMLEPFQGLGILHLGGEEWRRHRRIMTPFLHSDILRDFVEVFHRKSLMLVERLVPLADSGQSFNIYPYVALATSDMICATVLSTNMETQENDEKAFIKGIDEATLLMTYRVFHPWFASDLLFRLSPLFSEYMRLYNLFNDFTERMIRKKRAESQQRRQAEAQKDDPGDTDKTHTRTSGRKRPTFLDLMIDCPEDATLTDHEIREETKTLVTVASGGSVHILGFTLLCLALRPDIQEKCVEELDAIYGDDLHRPTDSEDLPHMEYLERVIKEALRLFPSIPLFGRDVPEDIQLPSGYKVPAGAQLVLFNMAVHRDPRHFPQPEEFDPDRFLPENSSGRHPFAYVPFSAGLRNCIGQRYALMQLKTTVATLLRHYRLLPGDRGPRRVQDVKTNLAVTLAVRGGYHVRLQHRNKK